MADHKKQFELAENIEHYVAVLSKLYKRDGLTEKLSILVNAQIRVIAEWTYDNWNGGTYGHALYLTVPEDIFLRSVPKRKTLQNELCSDLNEIHSVQDEHIAEVFLEMESTEDGDWRSESGVLESPHPPIPEAATKRIWGELGYRVFLSHKSGVKVETSTVKEGLRPFGISAFVAHEDIHPTKEWQDEIETALKTMHAFVALLTKDFHESDWTDQEVGFALGMGVPVIAVRLGRNPYGFIGKFQALPSSWEAAPVEIAKLLIGNPVMLDAYIESISKCRSWNEGITLSHLLPSIHKLSEEQIQKLVYAYNTNSELSGSWGFNGSRPQLYGIGLAGHLNRITGRQFSIGSDGVLVRL